MVVSKNQSRRYYTMHVGKGNKYGTGINKRVHRTWWGAQWHVFRIKMKFKDELQVYRCYWTDDEQWLESALHYHCGHSRYYVADWDEL
jgi:hypothetical protein